MQFWQPGLKTYVEGSVFCAQFPKKRKQQFFSKNYVPREVPMWTKNAVLPDPKKL